MYKINNVNIIEFGIIPGNISDSNIAIEGIFDLPSRIGKCYHVWSENSGIEAYVDRDDICLGERTLNLATTLWCATEAEAQKKISSLQAFLQINDLVDLTTDYGSFSVVVDSVKLDYWCDGKGKCTLSFKEPKPNITTLQPALSSPKPTHNCIDGYSFADLDLVPKSVQGVFDINGKRELKTTFPSYGGIKEKEVDMQMWIIEKSVAQFKNKVAILSWLFSSEGIRTINISGTSFECFAMSGFKITNFLNTHSKTIGLLTIKLTLV